MKREGWILRSGRSIINTFKNRCQEENGLELSDETVKMFLNAKGTVGEVDKDINQLLAYIDGKTAEGEFAQDVAAEAERVKQHDETRLEYMTLMMELKAQRREGREEGRAEGRAEEQLSSIRNLMESVGWTSQQAMEPLKIPADKQKEYAEML